VHLPLLVCHLDTQGVQGAPPAPRASALHRFLGIERANGSTNKNVLSRQK
jgi:hypothetical protein